MPLFHKQSHQSNFSHEDGRSYFEVFPPHLTAEESVRSIKQFRHDIACIQE